MLYGRLREYAVFFGFDRTFGIVLAVALPVVDNFVDIHFVLIFFEVHDTADVFADNVEFEVHYTAFLDLVEIGMLVGVGNDRHLETVVLRVAYGEAYPVHGNRSFLYGHIAFGSHFGIEVVGEGIVSASVDKIYFCAAGCLVHMALHDVSVEAAVHEHATFEIHFVSDRESP